MNIKRIIAKSGIEHNCPKLDNIMNVHIVYFDKEWFYVSHDYGNHDPVNRKIIECPFCNKKLE